MQVSGSGMFSSPSLDLCSGHSGSGVTTADGSRFITAVVSGVLVDVGWVNREGCTALLQRSKHSAAACGSHTRMV